MTTPPPVRPHPITGRRRSRLATTLGTGLLLLPVLEIAVAVAVGQLIGAGWTLLAILASSLAGLVLLRRLGAGVFQRLSTPPGAGFEPTARRAPGEGGVLALAGLLLTFPGLATGLAGLLLVLPPVRRMVARRAGAVLTARWQRLDLRTVRVVQGEIYPPAGPAAPMDAAGQPGADQADVQVIQVRDLPPPPLPGPPAQP